MPSSSSTRRPTPAMACQRRHQRLHRACEAARTRRYQRLADLLFPAPPERGAGLRATLGRRFRDQFVGVGLASSEWAIRRRSSRACSRVVVKLGLRVVAHAGEEARRPTSGARSTLLQGRAHRPRRAGDAGPGADAPAGGRAHPAHGLPAVQPQAVRVPAPGRSQPGPPARGRHRGHRQLRTIRPTSAATTSTRTSRRPSRALGLGAERTGGWPRTASRPASSTPARASATWTAWRSV